MRNFRLSETFLEPYKTAKVNWGYGALSYMTYKRSYARKLPDGSTEEWWQTVQRVVEGVFSIQKKHCDNFNLEWNTRKSQKSAQIMFDKIFNFKMLPPGRGLWSLGTETIDKVGSLALTNCCTLTTEHIDINFSDPFCTLMDFSMLGCGVGHDTKGAGKIEVTIKEDQTPEVFVVPDSREGWVECLKRTLEYFQGGKLYTFDYSEIRPAGSLIKTFGGIAPGPEPLKTLIKEVSSVLSQLKDKKITSVAIVDIMDMIGKCVVSGNIRRCLPENTQVYTLQGYKNIQDITIGDIVTTAGRTARVTNTFYQGKQPLVEIKHQYGSFKCTENHKLAVFGGIDTYSFIPAKDLTSSNLLVWDINGYAGVPQKLPQNITKRKLHDTNSQPIEIPEYINENIAWLIGQVHGDGYVHVPDIAYVKRQRDKKKKAARGSVSIAASPGQYEQATKLVDCFKEFNAKAYIKEYAHDKAIRIYCTSVKLAEWFKTNIKRPNESIRIPEFIKNAPKNIRFAYLAGVFDADGSISSRPTILCVSIYKEFLKELQLLYAGLGVPTKIRLQRNAIGKWKALYNLSVLSGEPTDIIQSGFGLSYKWEFKDRVRSDSFTFPTTMVKERYGKQLSTNQTTTKSLSRTFGYTSFVRPIKIKSVEYTNEVVDTYDIEVENIHQFTAEGFVVHNSAIISLSTFDDIDFIEMKDPIKYEKEVQNHRWCSNNSIFAEIGMDYRNISNYIAKNGEPGLVFLENAKSFGRRKDGYDNSDYRVNSPNPCGEILLEPNELCNLGNVYPAHHDSLEDFLDTLKYIYLYCKTITLIPTHNPKTNSVIMRNRRIGISLGGVQQAITKFTRRKFYNSFCEEGYKTLKHWDKVYSEWLGIPQSIRITTEKPDGSTALVAGATPGVHFPHSRSYIRNVRFAKDSNYVEALKKAGYYVEDDYYDKYSVVVSFPIQEKNYSRSKHEISMLEQFKIVSDMQNWWADNAVSCTITFKNEEESLISEALSMYETELKTVSLLPLEDHSYVQAPYISIIDDLPDSKRFKKGYRLAWTTDEFNTYIKQIDEAVLYKEINKLDLPDSVVEKYCSNDQCTL